MGHADSHGERVCASINVLLVVVVVVVDEGEAAACRDTFSPFRRLESA